MKVWYEDYAAKRDKALALEKEVVSLEEHITYLIAKLEARGECIATLRGALEKLDMDFNQFDPRYSGPRTKVPRIPDMHYRVKEVLERTSEWKDDTVTEADEKPEGK